MDIVARLPGTRSRAIWIHSVTAIIARRSAIALYQQWIEANNDTSPLLYAAWFNIGVLYAQGG